MELLSPITEFKNQFLWRFMDIHKFLHFARCKQLFFQRLDLLDDPIEGLSMKVLFLRSMYKIIPSNKKMGEAEVKDLIRRFELGKEKLGKVVRQQQQSQFVNCWFLSQRESMAMWNLYSSDTGVALKFEAQELIELVASSFKIYEDVYAQHKTYGGKVEYMKLNPFDSFQPRPKNRLSGFKKELAYYYESEFRFLIAVHASETGKYDSLKLDMLGLEEMEFHIIAHPNMKEFMFENLKPLMRGFTKAELRKSEIEV